MFLKYRKYFYKMCVRKDLLDEMVRMWLEILNAAVLHALVANPHLLYHLLYERDLFSAIKIQQPHYQDLLSNIDLVLLDFTAF